MGEFSNELFVYHSNAYYEEMNEYEVRFHDSRLIVS